MSTTTPSNTADAAGVPIMLTELRLPTMKRLWVDLAEQSNREGWPAERFLGALLGHEMAERETRRLARARVDSQLPPGKSLDQFDFSVVSTISKAQVMALAEADSWWTSKYAISARQVDFDLRKFDAFAGVLLDLGRDVSNFGMRLTNARIARLYKELKDSGKI
jgi:hypothetical protein